MNEFLNKLRNYKQGLNLRIMVRAVVLALLCLAAGIHLYYLAWLNLAPESRVLFYLNLCVRVSLALLLIYIFLKASRGFYTELSAARWLDRQVDHGDDLYQNLFELRQQKTAEPVLDVLAGKASQRLGRESYRLPRPFEAGEGWLLLFVLLGIGSVWALTWNDFHYALRQFYTNKAATVNYKSTIEVSPGNATVGKNQQLTIRVVDADTRLKHRLFYRWDSQWRELGMSGESYSFDSVQNSFEYYIQNEAAKSALYKVVCLDEPFAKSWEVHYKYPAYTGLGSAIDSLSYGNIEAFKHSEAILSISTNIPVKQAVMKFGDGTEKQMQRIGESEFSVRLTVTEPQTWYLELTDELGRKSAPEQKTISVTPDLPPQVRILFPGEDVTLDQSQRLPLIISADDDFGLRNLTLHWQLNNNEPQSASIRSVITSKLLNLDYSFDLSPLGMLPGDVVTYWAQVQDNSPERQSAQSARYKARFPSIEEIYREIERQESMKTGELQSALEESRQLQKDFEQKRRELLKDKDPKWEDKKELEKILQDQEKLSEQVDQVADDFQDMINKLQRNEALSRETIAKMQKIQELMEEISNDELRKAMERFGEALQKMDPRELRKAMENFKFSMEDFSKKIDQTLQLLESIKQEQAMEKALELAKEMEQMQAALKEKTDSSRQDSQQLAQEQEKIGEMLKNLEQQLEQTKELLDPAKDKQMRQELSELQEQMKNSQMQQQIQQSASQLKQNQRQASSQTQAELLQKMRRFTLRLGEMKNSMGGGSQQEVMTAMQNAIRELLIFSKKHEELRSRLGPDPYVIVPDLISQYEGVQISLNRLFSKPQVSLFVPPKFYIDLTDTNKAYREVFVNVNETMYGKIPPQMELIQRGLNLMVYDLMQALNNPSAGSGGGSGMQSLLQTLDQMGQQQMAMTMLTEQLMMQMQQQGGGMDAAMQQQIQKLATDQQRLADNLKRALQNDPAAQKQGNAIKQIIDEAEAVSRQLRSNQLSQDLLEKQENIVSRLLDAQRSINKREFTEKRKGEAADPSLRQAESAEDFDNLRRKAMLDDAYRLFPPAYQQVILKYLKLLNE